MNKTELIDAIAKEAGLSKKDAAAALNAFTDTVTKELKKKGKVQLVGFGTFETTKRAARTGKNPQTGAAIKIPASVAPKFKAGKALIISSTEVQAWNDEEIRVLLPLPAQATDHWEGEQHFSENHLI